MIKNDFASTSLRHCQPKINIILPALKMRAVIQTINILWVFKRKLFTFKLMTQTLLLIRYQNVPITFTKKAGSIMPKVLELQVTTCMINSESKQGIVCPFAATFRCLQRRWLCIREAYDAFTHLHAERERWSVWRTSHSLHNP